MTQRGRDHYRVLADRAVTTRTFARLLNLHYSNIRTMGEGRGFNERHRPRLKRAADLVARLPKRVAADPWLKTPHPALAGRSPVDLISAYGEGAPIPDDLPMSTDGFATMPRRRWLTTFLALVEVRVQPRDVVRHLGRMPLQRRRDGEEFVTIDVRWMWSPGSYPTTFVIAEVGALHRPRRADRRWETVIDQPLSDSTLWDSLGYAQPLREALLTHWHHDLNSARVGVSLNDTPVPMDIYDRWSFIRRKLWDPPTPPWDPSDDNPVKQYLKRLVEGGPPVPDDYWPFPGVRQGRISEMWSLWQPFDDVGIQVHRGPLKRYRFEFLGEHVNTAIRDSDGAVIPGDPRAVRILTDPEARP